MENDFLCALPDIPAGLAACRLNGRQLHIVRMASDAIWLRAHARCETQGTLEVCFRCMDGKWENIIIENAVAGEARRDEYGVLLRFSVSNAVYAAQFRRAMGEYAGYIRAFEADCVGVSADYPYEQDEIFPEGEYRDFSALQLPDDREICISLHTLRLYALFLEHSFGDFLRIYRTEYRLPEFKTPTRLYIGNPFCRQLFPDERTLSALLARARSDGLAVTLVTAPDPRMDARLLKEYSGEMLVNDWGLLYRLKDYPRIEPLLGTLLNKRRKDPRLSYKMDRNSDLLRENPLNDPCFRDFLRSMGVRRLEFERCGYDYALPGGECSLHMPWYQANTSVYCPLRALCERGDRGFQSDDGGCPHHCERVVLRYPAHLKMQGRWNSLFALDDRPADGFPGFDRIVLNL